jgi:MFS family permease
VQLGLLGLVRAIALMSASFAGGAVADRRNRRTVMLVTQLTLLLLSLSLALATILDSVNVFVLYVVAAAMAATQAFDGPARQALIPALVPRSQLAPAMSLNMLAMSTARMAGPAVGGVSVAVLGVGGTYILDSTSFLATIFALLVMRTSMAAPEAKGSGLAAVLEGLSFIKTNPIIWGIMGLDFLATLLGSTVGLAPVFAEDVLDVGPQGLGLLLSAPAAGSVIGALLISFMPNPNRPGYTLVLSVVAYGVFLALFGASTGLVMALLMLLGAGAADSVSVAMRHTVRNLATPDELRGRVAAAHSALAMGGPRLGEFQSGITASFIGPRWAMVAGGLAVIGVAALVGWRVPAVTTYRYDDAFDDEFVVESGAVSSGPAVPGSVSAAGRARSQ